MLYFIPHMCYASFFVAANPVILFQAGLVTARDEHYMRTALEEAEKARALGEVPVGAVLVRQDSVCARAHNSPISRSDPSAHAEMLALREAALREGNYRLTGTTLYVTLEPCVMCMGAVLHARIERLVFGAADPRTGAAGSVFDLTCDPRLNHTVRVSAGVLEAQCRSMLQDFFQDRRAEQRRDGRVG